MIIECSKCLAFTETDINGGFEYLRNGDTPSGRYVLLKCKKCDSPILVKQDNIGNMCEGDIWDSPVKIFPSDISRVNTAAPKLVRDIFEEACRCYKAQAYTATAIMCRKALESICDAHQIKERNLISSLNKMKSTNVIDERLYVWADMLRLVGNEAAHDVNADVSKEDANDMIDFTNAIIDYIFSFSDKFIQFKNRRNK